MSHELRIGERGQIKHAQILRLIHRIEELYLLHMYNDMPLRSSGRSTQPTLSRHPNKLYFCLQALSVWGQLRHAESVYVVHTVQCCHTSYVICVMHC